MPPPDDAPSNASRARLLKVSIALTALAVTVLVFLTVDSRSHSVSDTLYGMVIPSALVALTAAVLWWAVGVRSARSR